MLVMSLVMALITLRFMILGGWLVLPFMLAEFFLVAWAFRSIGRRCTITERIVITDDALLIHHEEEHNPKQWSFPLHWVNIDLRPPPHPSHGSRLLVGSHGKWIELADFLTNEERASLAQALRQAITDACQPNQGKREF